MLAGRSECIQFRLQLGQRGADGQVLGADGLALAAADAVAGLFGIREAGGPLVPDGVRLAEHNEAIPRQYCLAKDVQYYCRDCMQYMGKTVDAYISNISQITKITIETNLAELSCAALNDSWA